MPLLSVQKIDEYLYFDENECRSAGRALAAEYQNAEPFPHIVIDQLLDPEILRDVAQNYPTLEGQAYFDRDQERYKSQFKPESVPNGRTRNLLAELNSRAFLAFLEEMTGITGLISDPYFSGAGLHVTRAGGHLSVHADFNIHGEMKVERRLNLLVYLNEDWPTEYRGELELWDRQMKACVKSIAPLLGRAVVFNTSLDSFHGQPDPIACPPGRDRRSIATYYYTAFTARIADVPQRSTTFQTRPGTGDRPDWRTRTDHLINDWVPPRLQRFAKRLNPF